MQVKRLLLPLKGQDDDAPQRLCLLDFLCTVVPLRDSVVRLVLDKMIQCCSPQGLSDSGTSAAPQALPPKYCARVTEFGVYLGRDLISSAVLLPHCFPFGTRKYHFSS